MALTQAPLKAPLKTWLMLALVVLLLHLALLQTWPLHLVSKSAAQPIATSFATRMVDAEPTITSTRAPNPAPMPPLRAKPRPSPKTQTLATPPDKHAATPLEDAATGSESGSESATPLAELKPTPLAALDQASHVAFDVQADALFIPQLPQPAQAPDAPTPTLTLTLTPTPAPEPTPEPEPEPTSTSTPAAPPRDKVPNFLVSGVPKAVKLIYQVEANKFPYRLSGELLWAPAQDHYEARLSFGALGQSRQQTSRGLLGPQGLLPERFSDKFRNEVAAHFNRAQGKVTFSANTPDAALLQGAQDRLSVLIQLAAMVSSAPERFTPATTLTIQTVGPRDASLWLFTVGDMENLVLPGGTLQGLKLSRNPRHPYDQQVDIWLAPALGYLPARVRITEANGDALDQKWYASEPATRP